MPLPLIFAAVSGFTIPLLAQQPPTPGNNYNPGPAASPGSGAISNPFTTPTSDKSGASTRQKPEDAEPETDKDTGDDTLYRMKTSNSLAPGAMGRDEGELTIKPRKRERVLEVDSTKKLPSSGTDPKFQGSLLTSSVGSIDDLGAKTTDDNQTETEAKAQDQDQDAGDPRFKTKRLVFKPAADTKEKTSGQRADSSPSPSPSASGSPTPSNR